MSAEPNPPSPRPVPASQAPTSATPPYRPKAPALVVIPPKIGHYRVIRLIASGGMGDVYEGFDDELKIPVAIKVAHADLASRPEIIEQIRSEASRLASVKRKEFICRVLSAGDTTICGVSVPYVAMEFESGAETLGGPLSNAWSIKEKVECFLHVCEAVASLHEQHLVHADIKPSNILIVEDKPKLIDFGIARVVRRLGGEQGQWVAGTPGYLDPAVLANRQATPDQRSDIYSLGMTLAEFLSGRSPELAPGHETGTPPTWPSRARPPSGLNRSIDKELDGIILRAIDPDPARRFQRVQDMGERLQEWLAFRRSLAARVADARRGWTRSMSLLLVRSRVFGTGAIALAAALIALACSFVLFDWTSAARLTQVVPSGMVMESIDHVRVIDGSDIRALLSACEKHGISIRYSVPSDLRRAWALLAHKLAGAGPLRAVGLDLIFLDPHPTDPEADAELKRAILELANVCESKSVALPMDTWHNELTPSLREKGRIRSATASVNEWHPSHPAMYQLAFQRNSDILAAPSFALVLAGMYQRPDSELRVTLDRLKGDVRVTFERQSASGVWLSGAADQLLLTDQTIQAPEPLDRVRSSPGDLLARFPVLVPTEPAIAGCTKSASEVLGMSPSELRVWIGSRAVIVMGNEKPTRVEDRAIFPAYFQASVIESLATQRIVRIPGIFGAFVLTFVGALLGAVLGWCALAASSARPRVLLPVMTALAIALGLWATTLGCASMAQNDLIYVNPIVVCLAVTLAAVAVVILGRAGRAHLGTDL